MEEPDTVRGWLENGVEVELTPSQAEIVSGLLRWHADGIPYTLPLMGRQAGKTVIMSTVAHYFTATNWQEEKVM